MKVAVLGGGAWGTAISLNLAACHGVTLWLRNAEHAAELTALRENRRYLPGFKLPAGISVETDLRCALHGSALALIATPTSGLRPLLRNIAANDDGDKVPLVWLCKGFASTQLQLPHQVAEQELTSGWQTAVLSGPSFAGEVASGLPAALTLAGSDPQFLETAAQILHGDTLRIYSSDDQVGVETAGAIKNVIAIAAGICDGLELGNSARAALITRGLAEITRLGLRLGGRLETFMGLAGVGDLMLTCSSAMSRNRTVGFRLAQGKKLAEILAELGHVAEGVHTARSVVNLARDLDVDMPIAVAVCRVMDQNVAAKTAVEELLHRDAKAERR